MKRLTLTLGLVFFSSNSFALKYMCSKAVRGNSGKYNSVKNSFHSYQSNGQFAAKRQELLSTLDAAISEIQSAGCPMDDAEVTKVLNPIKQLRTEIAGATAAAAPPPSEPSPSPTKAVAAPTAPNVPTTTATTNTPSSAATEKLSYPCRQVLRRQSGKPKEFERTLGPLRDAVKNGKTVGSITPGFFIDTKVEAALSDLLNSSCPRNHPDVASVIDELESQKKEIPEIYAELKKRLDAFGKKADVNNYPDYKKDTEIFDVIVTRYKGASRLFVENFDFNWVDGKGNEFLMRNVKNPIFSYDQLKNLLENMTNDGNAYNSQIKLVETKYKELFSANRVLASQYVRVRDNAAKILGSFYKNELERLKKILATTVEFNLKVLELAIKDAVETRSPEFFRGDNLKNILRYTDEAITLIALTGKENKEKAPAYISQFKEINKNLKRTQDSLAEVMLKEQRLGKERYEGSDKEKVRTKIINKFKEYYPNKELIKVHMANENWKVSNYVSWSSGNAYHYHYSELGFYAIVKDTADVALMVGGWYHVDHKQRDKITVTFTFHKPDDMYQNKKILIKNL